MAETLPHARYERLTGILERYIGRSTMTAMLKTVLDERGVTPESMSAEDLSSVVEEVMIGLRLFCTPSRIPDLMLELAELCDREVATADEPRSQMPSSHEAAKPS
jgi:hypothetical protein